MSRSENCVEAIRRGPEGGCGRQSACEMTQKEATEMPSIGQWNISLSVRAERRIPQSACVDAGPKMADTFLATHDTVARST